MDGSFEYQICAYIYLPLQGTRQRELENVERNHLPATVTCLWINEFIQILECKHDHLPDAFVPTRNISAPFDSPQSELSVCRVQAIDSDRDGFHHLLNQQ